MPGGRPRRRPKTVRWVFIVGLLLVLVLGGLYWFNRFREKAIASYLRRTTSRRRPQISAVVAETATVPRYAPAIGSLAAVHQVTINPEVGGRVDQDLFQPRARRSRPATRWSSSTTRPTAATSPITSRRRAGWRSDAARKASLAQRQYRLAGNGRPEPERNSTRRRPDGQDPGDHRAEADPRPVCRPARRAAGRCRAISQPRRARSSR